jgi:hypothetical protein
MIEDLAISAPAPPFVADQFENVSDRTDGSEVVLATPGRARAQGICNDHEEACA